MSFVEGDKKSVVLINLRNRTDKISAFLKEFFKNKPHQIVFFGRAMPHQFANATLNIRTSEDYLAKEDYEAIDNYVFEGLSKSWHLYREIADYRGIPLGKMYEYDFQKFLTPRVKNLEVIRKAVDKENIQQIIAIEDTGELGRVAKLYANYIGKPMLVISFSQNRRLIFKICSSIKSAISSALGGMLDNIALKRNKKIKDGEGLILIDAKLLNTLKSDQDEKSYLRCLLEEGIGVRVNIIMRGGSYLPLYLRKTKRYSKDCISYKKRWKDLCSEKDFKDIFKYKGISIWEIVYGRLSAFFLEVIPRIIKNINTLDTALSEKKIKIAVLRNDVKELERTVIFGLRIAKVPSLVIQHGILAETNGHNFLLADKFAAWGRASVDWYRRFGNSPEKFEITGNPCFDALANRTARLSKQALCRQVNLDENKGIILFATQQVNKFSSFWTDDLFWVMADRLLKIMPQFPDKQLIIKADPYETLSPYRNRIFASSYNNVTAVKDIDIYTLIFLSDLIITLDSTVGLESMVFDKPLITVNLTKRKDRVPYAEEGAAIGVYKEEDLPLAINKTLTDKETISQLKIGRSSFLEEYAYGIDGKSKERIANLLKHYVEN